MQEKVFLEISQNLLKNTCARVSFLIKLEACNFIKKETLAQVFSCEFCEISKNTFFIEHLWATASGKGSYDLMNESLSHLVNHAIKCDAYRCKGNGDMFIFSHGNT